jgi:5'-3' exonuclease
MLRWLWCYYNEELKSESEAYMLDYAPLLRDVLLLCDVLILGEVLLECKYCEYCKLRSVEGEEFEREMCKLDAYSQLSYVLPRSSLNLLPKELEESLLKESSELYPLSCDLEIAYCSYLWECHPKLPEIGLERIKKWNERSKLYRESLKKC